MYKLIYKLIYKPLLYRPSGQGVRQSPLKKFFLYVLCFPRSPSNGLFERSKQKITWKLILYKSKLK